MEQMEQHHQHQKQLQHQEAGNLQQGSEVARLEAARAGAARRRIRRMMGSSWLQERKPKVGFHTPPSQSCSVSSLFGQQQSAR
jgi:hypothetical protein